MCGFAGILTFPHRDSDTTPELLRAMSDTIAHRGPDDEGVYLAPDRALGFAFRRLSIIDLSPAGHQPMANADGSVWIVFNGEIYNHRALRGELEAAGHAYRSRSDTETLLYAYEEWGERFVERLEGMFAIALWDARRRRLLLYRDRLGVKPLYHAVAGGRLVFASEIKAILAHPAVTASMDPEAFYHYCTFIHTPAPRTLFAGISKLEPAHYLRVEADGRMELVRYWHPLAARVDAAAYADEETVAERIRALFRAAVEKRMMSDVPFGVFLSGGIDSSANVAVMAQLMSRPVDTFTVAIKDQEATNEFQWARRIARQFGANHHEIVIDDAGFLDLLPLIVRHQDEPLADPVCFPLYHVSKLARESGTIVIQVGEGSDELFAGYTNYLRAVRFQRAARAIDRLPRALGRAASAAASPLLAALRVDYRQNMVKHLLEGVPVFWSNATAFYETEKRRLLAPFLAATGLEANSYALVAAAFARNRAYGGTDDLMEIVAWELQNRLAELLLMRVDKVTMSVSLEARVPFLDHALVEYAVRIPTAMKIRGGVTKAILKRAFRGLLPDEIIDRKKIGFAGSGKTMLTRDILAHARALLLSSRHGYFDTAYVRGLLDEYERRGINYTPQIWALYNFELWHRMWIEREAL
jgi:asparagine synthase (glutamine-hydrolysing)